MVKIKKLRELIKDMKDSFDKDKDPKNWKVIAGRTPQSYNDLFFCQSNKEEENVNLWQIKTENMSPYNILGVGTKIKNIDNEIIEKIEKEGKPATPSHIFGMLVPQKKGIIAAAGPMNYSDKKVHSIKEDISERNSVLEKLLKKRLKELIEKEHPNRFDMFG